MNQNQSTSGVDPHSSGFGSHLPEASWPVLARLPRVGEPAAARPAAAVRIDGRQPPAPRTERRATAETVARGYAETPTFGDAPAPAATAPADASRPVAAAKQWRHRIDQAVPSQSQFADGLAHAQRPAAIGRESLASRFFQWYASLAPYTGVAVMAVLLATAVSLYWLGFGQRPPAAAPTVKATLPSTPTAAKTAPSPDVDGSQLPMAPDPAPRFNDSPAQAESPHGIAAGAGAAAAPPIDWSAPALPNDSAASATAQRELPPSPSSPAPMTSVTTGPTLPITPTPPTMLGEYPITPYASFNFDALRSIVAELPPTTPVDGPSS